MPGIVIMASEKANERMNAINDAEDEGRNDSNASEQSEMAEEAADSGRDEKEEMAFARRRKQLSTSGRDAADTLSRKCRLMLQRISVRSGVKVMILWGSERTCFAEERGEDRGELRDEGDFFGVRAEVECVRD